MVHTRRKRTFLLVILFSLAGTVWPQNTSPLPTSPSAFIERLYSEVIRYQPLGLLEYEYSGSPKRKIVNGPQARNRFTPYLSQSLRHQIALYDACINDWFRQTRDSKLVLKAPSFEGGIFSGGDEFGEPERFQISKIEVNPDGSLNAFVNLFAPDPPQSLSWVAEVFLIREGNRLAVNDVIYMEDPNDHTRDERLSKILSTVCNKSQW